MLPEDIKGAEGAFASGFNCAEAVSMSVCRELGVVDDTVPKAATGLEGFGVNILLAGIPWQSRQWIG